MISTWQRSDMPHSRTIGNVRKNLDSNRLNSIVQALCHCSVGCVLVMLPGNDAQLFDWLFSSSRNKNRFHLNGHYCWKRIEDKLFEPKTITEIKQSFCVRQLNRFTIQMCGRSSNGQQWIHGLRYSWIGKYRIGMSKAKLKSWSSWCHLKVFPLLVSFG